MYWIIWYGSLSLKFHLQPQFQKGNCNCFISYQKAKRSKQTKPDAKILLIPFVLRNKRKIHCNSCASTNCGGSRWGVPGAAEGAFMGPHVRHHKLGCKGTSLGGNQRGSCDPALSVNVIARHTQRGAELYIHLMTAITSLKSSCMHCTCSSNSPCSVLLFYCGICGRLVLFPALVSSSEALSESTSSFSNIFVKLQITWTNWLFDWTAEKSILTLLVCVIFFRFIPGSFFSHTI